MKYLCLVYQEESSVEGLTEGTDDAIAGEVLDHCEELRLNGHLIAMSPLQSVRAGATIRVRNGRVSVSEGSFMQTKEQLDRFYLIEARDLNDAIRMASRMPSARLGCIEVRPLKELGPQ